MIILFYQKQTDDDDESNNKFVVFKIFEFWKFWNDESKPTLIFNNPNCWLELFANDDDDDDDPFKFIEFKWFVVVVADDDKFKLDIITWLDGIKLNSNGVKRGYFFV